MSLNTRENNQQILVWEAHSDIKLPNLSQVGRCLVQIEN